MKTLVGSTIALLLLAGCGAAPLAAPARAGHAVHALTERDTASIKAIKKEIRKHFEVATLDRIVVVKAIAIVPAPAWNEFVFELELDEEDLQTGFYTFKVAGVYDAVAKDVQVKAHELTSFRPFDRR